MSIPNFSPLRDASPKPGDAIYDPIAAPGMVAAWVAEGGGIKDVVGNLDLATVTPGVTVSTSPYGASLDFASGATVVLGELQLDAPCTLYALAQTGPQPGGLILHRGQADGIGWQVTGTAAFPAAVMGGSVQANLIPFSQGADEWYAIALVLDGRNGQIYVNAQVVDDFTNGALIGGVDWQFGDGTFQGEIADARLYSRALSQSELQSIQGGRRQWAAYQGRNGLNPSTNPDRATWRRIDGYGRRAARTKTKLVRRM